MKVSAELKGQDLIEMDCENPKHLWVVGCHDLLQLIRENKKKHGEDLAKWPIPLGTSHSEILLKEALLKQRNQWQHPYLHTELCHCRSVNTEIVDQAIINGAHTPEKVSRITSASTACGTCRTDVEKILKYRVG